VSEKRLSLLQWQNIKKLPKLLDLRAPPPDVQLSRIRTVERNVGLPVKAAVLAVLVYYFFLSNWIKVIGSVGHSRVAPQERLLEFIPPIFLGYIILNGAFATLLIGMRHFSFRAIQRIVFVNCLSDSIFLAALTLVTEGFKNPYLYWVFLVLIVRNTISIPSAASQFTLNLAVSASYLLAGLADYVVQQKEVLFYMTDAQLRRSVELESATTPWNEAFLLRLLLLVLVTICCYGVQVLLEKQRRANEEAHEYTLRQEQLQAAGRLAAEIAHQLKNPLGIINNAAYTLQKTVKEGKTITQQIRIIREEVERSDRIITELMGYARLSEGQVEKLDITEELDRAIDQVFPAAAKYDVAIKRNYGAALPPILAQRGHLSEAFVNLLQNAREAMNGHGEIEVGAHYGEDYSVVVTIRDNGPGIPREKLGKIFEAYFTTKDKGTGLGLAIVKHNTELYHGTVEVQSEPGKGACFIVRLPAKTVFTVRK
jgi:signal transduction histidine kinase